MCDFQHAVWFGIVISGEHIGIMDETNPSVSKFLHQNGKYTELRGGLTGVQRGLWKTSLMSTKLKRILPAALQHDNSDSSACSNCPTALHSLRACESTEPVGGSWDRTVVLHQLCNGFGFELKVIASNTQVQQTDMDRRMQGFF
jgi:hypothetical protein